MPVEVPPGVRVAAYTLDGVDPLTRLRRRKELIDARRTGETALLASWDEALLEQTCDEVWIISGSEVVAQGDPEEMVAAWRAQPAIRWLEEQTGATASLNP